MAVSAFRSTSKRTQVGPSGDCGGSTPGTRNGHRRTHSFSDPSSKYFSDSSSLSDPRHGDGNQRRARASSRRFSMDSESEAEGGLKRYQRPRRTDGSESDGSRALRKSSSQSDFSKRRLIRRGSLFSDKETSGDELQVEERTIRAVHAQIKQIQNKHPTEDVDKIGLYDAMKAEVRQAIAELRQEIRQVSQSGEVSRRSSVQLEEASDLRKELEEQSERRARDLWSELEEEEQRCDDLANVVRDLLPDSNSKVTKRSAYRSRRKQLVSQSLDEDARKFFEECVSVSRLGGDASDVDGDPSERSSVMSNAETAGGKLTDEPLSQQQQHRHQDTESREHEMQDDPDRTVHDRMMQKQDDRTVQQCESTVGDRTVNEQVDGAKEESIPRLKGDINFTSSKGRVIEKKAKREKKPNDVLDDLKEIESKSTNSRRAPVNADGIVMPWLEWETGSDSSRRKAKNQGQDIVMQLSSSSSSNCYSGSGSSVTQQPISDFEESSHCSSVVTLSSNSVEELCWNTPSEEDSSEIQEFIPVRMRFKERILSGRMHLCSTADSSLCW